MVGIDGALILAGAGLVLSLVAAAVKGAKDYRIEKSNQQEQEKKEQEKKEKEIVFTELEDYSDLLK